MLEPLIALVVLVVIFVFMGIKAVPQGQEYTVERFGRYTVTLKPGLTLIIPLIDRIGARIDMRETVLDVPSQEVITKDNAMVKADGVVFYQVLDASKAAYEVRNLHQAILNLVMTNLRTVMGALDLDELLSQRDRINDRLLTVVDAATSPWGIKITRIEIKDIQPPQNLIDSMGRQMQAERERRALILEAEGVRQSAILKAEGEKQSAILQAEGRRESAFRDAEAREREAEAEGKAIRMVAEAASGQGVSAINYFIGQKYVESLTAFANSPNQKTVFMPLEVTGVLGSLGGLTELLKQSGTAQANQGGPWK